MGNYNDPVSIGSIEKVAIELKKGQFHLTIETESGYDAVPQEMTVDDLYLYDKWRAMYIGKGTRPDGKKYSQHIHLHPPDAYTTMTLYFATHENGRRVAFDEEGLRQVHGGSHTIIEFRRARNLIPRRRRR